MVVAERGEGVEREKKERELKREKVVHVSLD